VEGPGFRLELSGFHAKIATYCIFWDCVKPTYWKK